MSDDVRRPRRNGERLHPGKPQPRPVRQIDAYVAQLEAVLESVDEGLLICDTAGRVPRMNRRAAEMLGYASVAEAGRALPEFADAFELYDPQGHPIPVEDGPLSRAVRGETFREWKVCLHNKRTGREWLGRCGGTPVRDERGHAVLTVLSLRELEEPADRAVEELTRLARLSQENPDPVFRVSAEHVLLYSNPAGEELCRGWGCRIGQRVPAAVREIVSAALADGAVARHEIAFDSHTYCLTVAPAVADGYVNIYARDITEHRRAKEALRQAEQKFRTIFDNTSDGIFLLDLEARKFAMCNASCLQMLGYTQEEFMNLGIPDLHLPADLPFIYAQFEKFLRGGKPLRHDIRFKRKDGSILFVDLSPDLVLLDGKRYVVVALKDITERKRAEETLAESEKKYRSLVENIPDVTWTTDRQGRTLFISPNAMEVYGYSAEEICAGSDTWLRNVHPDDRPRVEEAFHELFTRKKMFDVEYRIRRKDGTWIWLHDRSVSSYQKDGQWYADGVFSDITERKQMEEELRRYSENLEELVAARTAELQESEKRYRSLAENAPDVIQRFDRDLRHLYVNSAFELATGLSPDAVIGKTDRELGLPADLIPFWEKAAQTVFRTGESQIIVFEMPTPEGRRHYEAHLVPELAQDGSAEHILAITRDITERKRAEEALRESEEKYRLLFENANDAIYLHEVSREGPRKIFVANEAACRMLGYTREELLRMTIADIDVPEQVEKIPAILDRLFSEGYAVFETEHMRKDGSRVQVLVSIRTFDLHGTMVMLSIVRDITERKQAEEALRRLNEQLELQVAQRTEELRHTVDRLRQLTLELSQAEDRERKRIADILHEDVQQTLAAAKFHLNLLGRETRSAEESQEIVEQVKQMLKDAIERSRSLSHELSPVLYQVDLTEALSWLAHHMQRKHGMTVRVEAHGPVDSPSEPLKAFLYKVAQELLFNVVKHAGVNEARIRMRRLGPCLYLSVVDQGRGFDPEKLEGAAGFGLLSIRERVQLLGGRMKIRSVPGAGSRLLIAVPDKAASRATVPAEDGDGQAPPETPAPGKRPEGP
jgi:PAS domain S-box-containing protein